MFRAPHRVKSSTVWMIETERVVMLIPGVLGLSILIQLTAIILMLRLKTVSRRSSIWLFLAMGMLVLSVSEGIRLFNTSAPLAIAGDLLASLGMLVNSICILIAIILLGPVVRISRMTEASLRQREEQLQHIYDHSPALMHSLDEELRIRNVNNRWLERLGYARDEVIGQSIDLILAPECRERARREVYPRLWREGAVRDVSCQLTTKDGTVLDVVLSSNVTVNPAGQRVALELMQDLTERKQAEQALRESEEKFRKLAETARAAIFILQDRRFRYVNPCVTAITGYSADELVGRDIIDFLSPEAQPVATERWTLRMAGQELAPWSEWPIITRDGRRIWLDYQGVTIEYDGEQAILGTAHDITALKQMQEALEEREGQFRVLAETAQVAIFIVQDDEIRYANPYFHSETGYTQDDLQGRPFWEIMPPQYRDLVKINATQCLRNEDVPFHFELQISTQSGKELWADYHTALIEYHGQPALLCTAYMVTDRKEAEEALRQARAELECRVQERTAALVEANTRLTAEIVERERAETLMRLQRDLGLALCTTVGVRSTMRLCVEAALRATGMDAGAVYLQNTDGGLDLVYHEGLSEIYMKQALHFPPGTVFSRMVSQGEPVYSSYSELDLEMGDAQRQEGLKAFALIPIFHEGSSIACLSMASHTLEHITDEMREPLEIIASQVGSVLARANAEDAQRASEERFRWFAGAAFEGILISDQGTIVDVNERFADILGYAQSELIGAQVMDLVDEQDRETVSNHIREGYEAPYEIHTRRKDDEPLVCEVRGKNVVQHGRTLRVTAVRDITERKRMEEELRENEERYRLIFDHSPVGIIRFDREGFILDCNDRFAQIIGAPRSEIIGMNLLRSLSNDAMREAVVDAITGKLGEYEGPYRSMGGDKVTWLRAVYQRITGRDGAFLGGVGILEDITDRKATEEALACQAVELARSNAELQQFAYVASHDLQEPLRMVTSFVQLLAQRYQGKLDEEADEFISYAVEGAARMQQMIRDLLAYSRVETQGQPFVKTDLNAVLKTTLDNLKVAIDESGAAIEADTLPTITGDPTQLLQLLQNLIGNAIKFAGSDAPIIRITAEQDDESWVIAVKDNGIGIDPQFFERIFLIFQRLHTRSEFPGTGIGLAICKRIAERHGGRIRVNSSPGKGATFLITLPANGVEHEPMATEEAAGAGISSQ